MGQKLSTIQKNNNLNEIFREKWGCDEDAGFHCYTIYHGANEDDTHTVIQFQKGPRNEEGSVGGVLDGDLLEIVRDRLTHSRRAIFGTGRPPAP